MHTDIQSIEAKQHKAQDQDFRALIAFSVTLVLLINAISSTRVAATWQYRSIINFIMTCVGVARKKTVQNTKKGKKIRESKRLGDQCWHMAEILEYQ